MTPQQLKNAILQQAIQGKLVDQRAEEGTGQELYKVIQDEKQKLIQEGKLKKQKALPEITEDEIPFEIPDTWKWVRLREIVYNHGQKKPSSTFSYIDIGSIDNENQRLNENENIIEAEKAPSRARKIVQMDDVLYATVRPYLHNMCIIDKDFVYPPIASTGFAVMACFNNFYNKYLFYYLLSPTFDRYANSIENSKGVAYPAINDERLYKAIVPLPPFAEQKRIVEKIEELLPLVERYEKAWARLEELNKKFPLDMKKAILGQAIQGKLVEQRAEEGTGEELYKVIQDEKQKLIQEGKLKKQKASPEITEDEIPFEIPETWKWVRAGDVLYITMGQSPKAENINNSKLGYEFHQGKSNFSEMFLNKSEVYTTADNKVIEAPAIVMSVRAPVGDVNLLKNKIYIGRGLASFQIYTECNLYYIYYYFLTIKKSLERVSTGSTFKAINSDIVNKIIIPLPPLAEQRRIVEKIEELLPLVEKLK
jgi:putative type I restriction-modification system, S subunit